MTECTCEYDPFQCTVTHDEQSLDGQLTIEDALPRKEDT